MKKNRGVLLLHGLFWSVMLLLIIIGIFLDEEKFNVKDFFYGTVIFGIINISLFYINYIILIPQLVEKKKRYFIYVLIFIVLLGLVPLLKTTLTILFRDHVFVNLKNSKKPELTVTTYYFAQVFICGFFLVSSCIIKFTIDWFNSERIQRNLESERREMELQFLKSQLNPHFLFNSLNNIYSLAYQKSDKTADAIMKLSEIMRYMIYESNTPTVSLSKEVDYLKSYIELQKIRFKDGAYVEMNLNGEIDDQKIVPLMLISFVENAFKHGVVNDPEEPIKINIIANQKILHFSVINKKNQQNKDAQGGVGLPNVERRLQLIYPDRYKLNVVNSATHYNCELMIDI
ncbi:sensor histidine kinase [Pedobacter punctiformis]|uniref:Sensor histidine kinase n=1 Tax=Pedobacter punctiformis TaxID=3004097 RepID=A0ABT4LD89_9SPHI|nr:sensor histidine kinase [Pedobacter sp. HCMS5-2]MCZ4245880.1 sensor histidine kinase [Pedobacter sp. HCMS5-2]